ncbi:hypothetical protein EGT74_24590 [Chitinophaga lutea]|uniref:Uncharacterized protein n=1 Tax=Chitinophaga lutea TaxID=2488634 RepID=A0A3N4Q1D2_9BACT|nr:hypothetical protein [Chitinophaga lutea]RPE05564.1 hypothetical protein EGT74_24590 [Chitinophaga lutea]
MRPYEVKDRAIKSLAYREKITEEQAAQIIDGLLSGKRKIVIRGTQSATVLSLDGHPQLTKETFSEQMRRIAAHKAKNKYR